MLNTLLSYLASCLGTMAVESCYKVVSGGTLSLNTLNSFPNTVTLVIRAAIWVIWAAIWSGSRVVILL